MAIKLAVSFVFFLFAFSYALSDLDFPSHDVTELLPESDSKFTNIFLPSQKTGPEIPEIEPDTSKLVDATTDSAVQEIEPETNKPVDDKAGSDTLTFVSFRPINRHFRQRPVFPFRRCGGGLRRGMVKPWLMRIDGGEIPYGKDMIVEKDVPHHGVRKMPMPLKMERFQFGSEMEVVPLHHRHHHHHHHHQRFHGEEEEEEEHHHHHEHDHHDHEHDHHDHEHEHEHEHDHHGSLLRKIRKFLHHF